MLALQFILSRAGRPEFEPSCARLLEEGCLLLGRSGQRFLEECCSGHGFGSDLAGHGLASSSISFLKSSRPRMGSRSVSFAMWVASLKPAFTDFRSRSIARS